MSSLPHQICAACGGTVPAAGTGWGMGWNEDCPQCLAAAKRPLPRSHQHHPVKRLREERPWFYCVASDRCAARPARQAAHGYLMIVDRCRCGATRRLEMNGRHVNFGRWDVLEGL